MNKKILIGLILITVLAFFLRIYNLGNSPPSLSWDEISHGYNAYSIMKTGHDEWGQFLPLANFRAYGDYPLPLYMYLSIPSILIFGLNLFSIRLVSVILGTALVPVVFFLSKRVFKNELIGIFSGLMLALLPWSILTSRQVLQATPATFFVTLGIWLFLKGMEQRKIWAVVGTFFMGVSAYAYHNTRILAPVLLLALLIVFKNRFVKSFKSLRLTNKRILAGIVIVGAVFFIPLVPIILSPAGNARSVWVGIIDQGAINKINESRGKSNLPQPITRLVDNKVVYFGEQFLLNYAGYFDPNFLGFKGGTQYQFSVQGFGVFLPIELPFFYLGLFLLLKNFFKSDENEKYFLIWFGLSMVPAAVTRDPDQVVRSMIMLPLAVITAGYGFWEVLKFLKNKRVIYGQLLGLLVAIFMIFEFYSYYSNLLYVYPKQTSFAWQYGYEQVVDYIKAHQQEYSKVILTKKYGEPHEFVLFFTQYDPYSYQHDTNLIRYEQNDWFWIDRFSKFYFYNDEDVINKTQYDKNILLITSPGNYPKNAKYLEGINFLDGSRAFDIVSL